MFKAIRRRLITFEILVANHFGTFGDWWAAAAVRRLEKLSAEPEARS